MGKRSKQSGDYLENTLQSFLKNYESQVDNNHIAVVRKINEERINPSEGNFKYKKSLPADFIGVTTQDLKGNKLQECLPVGIECKNISTGSTFQLSKLKVHQLAYLRFLYLNCGISFLLIGFESVNRIYRIFPNEFWFNKIESTYKEYFMKNGKYYAGYTETLSEKYLFENIKKENVFTYQNLYVLGKIK